jgi:hypothetical protein
MLNVTAQKSSEAAKSYFAKSDYYSEGQELVGNWGGKGSILLGLFGEVDRKAFENLCDNLDPRTQKPLTPITRGNRRTGYDFTWSAPKSVSVVHAMTGDERIVQAFRDSIDDTMSEMEADMQTRVRKEKAQQDRTTGKAWMWAEFVHLRGSFMHGQTPLHARLARFHRRVNRRDVPDRPRRSHHGFHEGVGSLWAVYDHPRRSHGLGASLADLGNAKDSQARKETRGIKTEEDAVMFRWKRRKPQDTSDEVLLRWSGEVPFMVSDLLTNLVIFGATGSGKTNFSGWRIANAIVRHPRCTLLILASKPDDLPHWQSIFARADRSDDLIVFSPDTSWRFNPLQYLVSKGADCRDISDYIVTVGERLESGGETSGSSGDAKWFAAQNRLWFYNAAVILKIATGTVTATDVQHFIETAANSPAELNDPAWRQRFHNQKLKCAHEKTKSRIDANDCELANNQWLSTWTTMGDKTRGSIVAGMNANLHTANTGIVRAMLSENTNCSPDTMLQEGKSILVNFPTSDSGPTGRFICGAWKYCTQWQVLRRRPDERRYLNALLCDEFQEIVTNFDPRYMARCRAFGGCMVCLTQSVHALYAALGGENGKSQAKALLANFRYKLAHSVADYETAEMLSNLLGKSLQTSVGGSSTPQRDMFDDFFGHNAYTGNFSEHYEPVLQPNAFMSGLRTGRDGVSDAILIRSGEPFPNGANYLKCTFTRKERR